jgi:uncharacterized protein (TIGR03435 family)
MLKNMKAMVVLEICAAVTMMAPDSAAQSFEVASIKPCKDPTQVNRGGRGNSTPGRLNINCRSLMGVIQEAYLKYAGGHANPTWVYDVPIEGGPSWIRTERFDLNAKAEGEASIETMTGPMLQALLEDRFKLKIHRETREVSVYELTVVKGGPKLPNFHEGSCIPVDFTKTPLEPNSQRCPSRGDFKGPIMTITARGMTVETFAKLFLRMDRPVIDKTGIEGRFDFQLEFVPDESTPDFFRRRGAPPLDPAGQSIFGALQQLGLKLVPAEGHRDVLVVDSAERPSEN